MGGPGPGRPIRISPALEGSVYKTSIWQESQHTALPEHPLHLHLISSMPFPAAVPKRGWPPCGPHPCVPLTFNQLLLLPAPLPWNCSGWSHGWLHLSTQLAFYTIYHPHSPNLSQVPLPVFPKAPCTSPVSISALTYPKCNRPAYLSASSTYHARAKLSDPSTQRSAGAPS